MLMTTHRQLACRHVLMVATALALAACSTPPPQAKAPAPEPVAVAPPPPPKPEITSNANSPHAYRRDGANHLYSRNIDRIFRGKLPPLLKAVGVTRVQIDDMGYIQHIEWMRAPAHAPSVMAEIERTLRAAEPFPAPVLMGHVAYVDTWLWDQSGRFQLDTLTEGQRDRR